MSYELNLVNFIRENSNWEELISKDPYNIKVSRDNGYIIFKYNQIASDFNLPIVQECRGIILREKDFKPVCIPFYKFGNYGESYCPEIDWASASVQEKIDGSLIKVWFDGDWHISTNGIINAFKTTLSDDINCPYKSFGELFINELKYQGVIYQGAINSFESLCKCLDKAYTYMFELVTEYNRVVVPADHYDSSIYLLGARNIDTLKEIDLAGSMLAQIFCMPKRYNLHSLEDVKAAADILSWDDEGYVVCDKHYNRVKIKSPEYVKAHYIRNNNCITVERLVDIVLCGEESEFLIYAPDYADKLFEVKTKKEAIEKSIYVAVANANPTKNADRRSYAEFVKTQPEYLQKFLFAYDKIDFMMGKMTAEKWTDLIERVYND